MKTRNENKEKQKAKPAVKINRKVNLLFSDTHKKKKKKKKNLVTTRFVTKFERNI